MFRMNGNRKRPSKSKLSNQKPVTESKSEYQENFNEIILNDLVPNDKKEEFGLEDTQKSKKASGLKINLGLSSKKSSKRPSSKKKHKVNDEQEISDKKNKHKKHSTSYVQHKEKEITEIINEPKGNSEVIESSHLNKKVSHNKRKRRPSQNEPKIEEVKYDNPGLKEVELEDTIDENNGFRCEEKVNNEFNEENLKQKFENLVWSEDKFPKK